MIHVSLTKLFHLIPSLGCSLDRIMYMLHSWQECLSWWNRKLALQMTLDFALQKDLLVVLVLDHQLYFSNCFYPQAKENLYTIKNKRSFCDSCLFCSHSTPKNVTWSYKASSFPHFIGGGGVLEYSEKLKIYNEHPPQSLFSSLQRKQQIRIWLAFAYYDYWQHNIQNHFLKERVNFILWF